jgi:iron complex transport system substrate-binding protein
MKRSLLALALCTCALGSAADDSVVAVGGAVTEIVYALKAENRLAAVDTTSIYPAAALALPKVGYQRQLSAEGLLSTNAKQLIGTPEAGPPTVIEQVRNAGMRVTIVSNEHSVDGVRSRIRSIGTALGLDAPAKALESRVADDWSRVQSEIAALPGKPRVIFILAHAGPPMVAGGNTAADAMIRLAGAENAVKGFDGYRPLTPEGLAEAAPDAFVITREGYESMGGEKTFWTKPGFALTPAAKTKRVVVMDALYLLGFGPRLPQSVRDLARGVRGSAG